MKLLGISSFNAQATTSSGYGWAGSIRRYYFCCKGLGCRSHVELAGNRNPNDACHAMQGVFEAFVNGQQWEAGSRTLSHHPLDCSLRRRLLTCFCEPPSCSPSIPGFCDTSRFRRPWKRCNAWNCGPSMSHSFHSSELPLSPSPLYQRGRLALGACQFTLGWYS